VQDYPEDLTDAQSDVVGWIMSYLRDYADCSDDVEPDHLLKYEREVTEKLGELEQLGLAVFAGGYKAKQVFENGTSYWMPITVVLVARKGDPRIKRDADGSEFIKGVIPRKRGGGEPSEDAERKDADGNDGKETELQRVSASVAALGAELREFRKAMANGAAGFGQGLPGGNWTGGLGAPAALKSCAEPAPALQFRQAGRMYDVVFGGGAVFHINNTVGAKYLDYLLHHPNVEISAFDLEVAIRPEKSEVRSANSAQQRVDARAKREAAAELAELQAELEAAEGSGAPETVDRLKEEIGRVQQVIGDESLLNGDTGERARNNVRKAIGKVVDALRKGTKEEKAFAAHIDQFVSLGYKIRYNQPGGHVWQ